MGYERAIQGECDRIVDGHRELVCFKRTGTFLCAKKYVVAWRAAKIVTAPSVQNDCHLPPCRIANHLKLQMTANSVLVRRL